MLLHQCLICNKFKWGEGDWQEDPPAPIEGNHNNVDSTVCGSKECKKEFLRKSFE